MTALEQMIESGSLMDMDSIRNKIVNLSARKRNVMRDMRKLKQISGSEFEKLYSEWNKVNGYLTFFKELKNNL